MIFHATAFALALVAHPLAQNASACEIELSLAMDVSHSVTNAEYNSQVQELADALRDPAVQDAISWTTGGALATSTQWSGPEIPIQSVPWTAIKTAFAKLHQ